MAINYDELERELQHMQPRHRLYELVKKEMKNRGRWKGKPRGKPMPENLTKNRSSNADSTNTG